MSSLSDFATLGSNLLAPAGSFAWLAPLAKLGASWTDIAREINALGEGADIDSIDSLLAFLKNGMEDQRIVALLDRLGLTELRERMGDIEQVHAALPDQVRKLVAPVGSFAEVAEPRDDTAALPVGFRDDWVSGSNEGEVSLPIGDLSAGRTEGLGPGAVDLRFSAEARLACEAGALWPYGGDNVTPGHLQFSFAGELEAAAGGKLPFDGGELGGAVTSASRAALMYFYRPTGPGAIFAAEVARALLAVPNPFELAGVWNAMATSGLEGIVLALDGHSEVNVDVSLGKSLDLPEVLAGNLAITDKVRVKREAAYVLSVRSEKAVLGRQRLLVALSRDKAAATGWGLGIGLQLDVSALAGRVHALLAQGAGEWSVELERIKPLLLPGTWLRNQAANELGKLAESLVADEAIRAALVRDLGLVLGEVEANEAGLAPLLTERLAEKLNSVSGLALEQAETKAAEAVDRIIKALPALAAEPARARLTEGVADLIAQFRTAAEDLVRRVASEADPSDINRALKSLGVKVVDEANAADQAAAGLRELIARFDTLLHRALEATADGARHKIGAQLSFEESRETGLDMEIVAVIDDPTPEACSLFDALVHGKLEALQDLLQAGKTAPGFSIDPERSSIRRFHEVSRKTGFAFVAFGLELESSTVLSGEATITVLGTGDLTVSATGTASVSAEGPREGRSTTFVSCQDLLLAKAEEVDGDGRERLLRRSLALSLAASHRDKSLKGVEVTGFLSQLPAIGLVRPERVARAGQIYEEWSRSMGGAGGELAGDIAVTLTVESDGLQRMLSLGRDIRGDLTNARPPARSWECFNLALDAVLRTDRVSESELFGNVRELRRTHGSHATKGLTDRQWLLATLQAQRQAGGEKAKTHLDEVLRISSNEGPRMRHLTNALVAMNALADILQLMAEVYDAKPASSDERTGWNESDYARHEKLLAAASRQWIDLGSEWIFWFRAAMGARTSAFLLVLTALAKGCGVDEVAAKTLGDAMLSITMTPRMETVASPQPVTV